MTLDIEKALSLKEVAGALDALWPAYQTAVTGGQLEAHAAGFSVNDDESAPATLDLTASFRAYTKEPGKRAVSLIPSGQSVDIVPYLVQAMNGFTGQILANAASLMLTDALADKSSVRAALQAQVADLEAQIAALDSAAP